MADILAEILAHKRTEVDAAQKLRSRADIARAAHAAPKALAFLEALRPAVFKKTARIIAECKQKSPSRGVMIPNYDPVGLARSYAAGGAAAISVLTDQKFFGGSLAHLTSVRQAVKIPVLRKDFIIDDYQIYEARAAGADTFLLLSGVHGPSQLDHFIRLGRSLGMEPLIESHTAAELAAALSTSGLIFGVNNRSLKTFAVDLGTARDLVAMAHKARPEATLVCESGIKTPADIELMGAVGYKVFLIGEALVTHGDPEAGIRAMIAAV